MMSPDQPDPADPADPARTEVFADAHALFAETQEVEGLMQGVARDLAVVARSISVATDRRRAARFAPAVLISRDLLDSLLEDLAEIVSSIDTLRRMLGPVVRDEHPRISEARLALHRAHGIVQSAGETGREYANIGALATERVSDFAEADMLYEQIRRNLRRRDLAGVDARIARLVELERVLLVKGVTDRLVDVRRRREELAAGGRGDGRGEPHHYDDDYTI